MNTAELNHTTSLEEDGAGEGEIKPVPDALKSIHDDMIERLRSNALAPEDVLILVAALKTEAETIISERKLQRWKSQLEELVADVSPRSIIGTIANGYYGKYHQGDTVTFLDQDDAIQSRNAFDLLLEDGKLLYSDDFFSAGSWEGGGGSSERSLYFGKKLIKQGYYGEDGCAEMIFGENAEQHECAAFSRLLVDSSVVGTQQAAKNSSLFTPPARSEDEDEGRFEDDEELVKVKPADSVSRMLDAQTPEVRASLMKAVLSEAELLTQHLLFYVCDEESIALDLDAWKQGRCVAKNDSGLFQGPRDRLLTKNPSDVLKPVPHNILILRKIDQGYCVAYVSEAIQI